MVDRIESPKIGESLYAADWLTGIESEERLQLFEQQQRLFLTRAEDLHGVKIGSVKFYDLKPGAEAVPPVPAGIRGPNVRYRVAEAVVVSFRPEYSKAKLTDNLDTKDLKKLRDATRRAHRKVHPGRRELTVIECDTMINDTAPDTIERMMRQ